MIRICTPDDCKPVMALSRPEPGPLTRTSISRTPNFDARSEQVSAALCAANGVLLRLPLNPTVPAVAQHNTSPAGSVMVTIVLLKLALMYAMARVTFLRIFFFLVLMFEQILQKYLVHEKRLEQLQTHPHPIKIPTW